MQSLSDLGHWALSNADLILKIVFAIAILRVLYMLDNLKAILAKVQNELTAGITTLAAALAAVSAERDSLKAELEALKASLGDLPQVEADLAAAVDHALAIVPVAD